MPGRRLGRLRKGSEFDSAYSKGTVSSGPFFVVRLLANGLEESRWGFAVGKRLLPGSVDRNRVRRRLREAAARSGFKAGFDIVVTAKAPAVAAPFAAFCDSLNRELARAEGRLPG